MSSPSLGTLSFAGANATTRFLRDFNGMTSRGLQQSVPTGLLLLLYGYGWLPLASGSVLGLLYEAGHFVTWDCLPDSNTSACVRRVHDRRHGVAWCVRVYVRVCV